MSEELRRTLDAWTRAIIERDQAAAEQILAQDFVLNSVGGAAPQARREDWIARLPSVRSDSLEVVEYVERDFGETAVTQTRQRWVATMDERDLTGEYVIVDVYVREAGRWRPTWRISQRVT